MGQNSRDRTAGKASQTRPPLFIYLFFKNKRMTNYGTLTIIFQFIKKYCIIFIVIKDNGVTIKKKLCSLFLAVVRAGSGVEPELYDSSSRSRSK
jgi:hypothetical protein